MNTIISILLIITVFASNCLSQNRQIILSQKNDIATVHKCFIDSVKNLLSDVNTEIDILKNKYGEPLHKDERYPIISQFKDEDFNISYVIYNNTTIIEHNFLGTNVDVLITKDNYIFNRYSVTRDSFKNALSEKDGKMLYKYDIRNIVDVAIKDKNVMLDIMLTIPDSDIDYYFRIICSDNKIIEIVDVSEEYWDEDENY